MIAKNVTQEQLEKALRMINHNYENNITWNRAPEKVGRQFHFTLYTKSVEGPGHRLGFSHSTWTNKDGSHYKQKRMRSACWHVHGDFFDALFALNPDAVIKSAGREINYCEGNWIDWNAGSIAYPILMSYLCEC